MLDALPLEMTQEVTSYLPVATVASLATTCSKLYAATMPDLLARTGEVDLKDRHWQSEHFLEMLLRNPYLVKNVKTLHLSTALGELNPRIRLGNPWSPGSFSTLVELIFDGRDRHCVCHMTAGLLRAAGLLLERIDIRCRFAIGMGGSILRNDMLPAHLPQLEYAAIPSKLLAAFEAPNLATLVLQYHAPYMSDETDVSFDVARLPSGLARFAHLAATELPLTKAVADRCPALEELILYRRNLRYRDLILPDLRQLPHLQLYRERAGIPGFPTRRTSQSDADVVFEDAPKLKVFEFRERSLFLHLPT
ncbi:hypothetical protein C8R47DRAFT_1197870 [Mycena vitilis]|nr:hypothetical protein C8R47DRAFT_1197870 [Mycena vitilis]